MDLDLRQLVRITRRWWWLLLLAPIIAGATAHYQASKKTPLYSAMAILQVNPATGGSISSGDIYTGQSLAQSYAQIITLQPVLDDAAKSLGLPPGSVGGVSASASQNSLLIDVSAVNTNPQLAAKYANAVATSFQGFVVKQAAQLSGPTRKTLDDQIAATRKQLADIDRQIQQLQQGPKADDPTVKSQISNLQTTQTQQQSTLNSLLVTANQMDLDAAQMQTQVTLAQPAFAPGAPFAPRVKRTTLLAVFAGLLIAIGAVVLLEYLDNTVKTTTNFKGMGAGSLLAAIGRVPKLHGGPDQLFLRTQPKTNAAEAVRLLRANLEFAAAAKEISTLAISSPGPGEGKSTVTSNLGLAMAQAGFTVAIVDADLHRPSQHRIFDIRNERGLTTLLTHPRTHWRWAAAEVAPNLFVIPSGPLPPNPADLLSLDRLRELMQEIRSEVDVIVVDTPPLLSVSDPLVVATNVDGIALVCRAGRTRLEALRHSILTLQQGAVRIVGVVLNQQSARGAEGYYYYYSDYYDSDAPPPSAPAPAAAVSQTNPASGSQHD